MAVMAEAGDPAKPVTMTLMAGPIDTRVNPTEGERAGDGKADPVVRKQPHLPACPPRYPGGGAASIPALCSSLAFVSMNVERHRKAHLDLFKHLAKGEDEKAQAIKDFYDEYFAVLDLPAEFYLETVPGVPGTRLAGAR